MTLLILGVVLWWATHSIPLVAPQFRAAMVARHGEKTWRIALRPERIVLGAAGGPGVPGRVAQISYLGERAQLIVETDSLGPLLVSRPTWKAGIHPERDLPVTLTWDRDACVFLEEA